MRDYREKDVSGMFMDVRSMQRFGTTVTVRMISDDIGQSLSLSAANALIMIPLEAVADIIKVVEK